MTNQPLKSADETAAPLSSAEPKGLHTRQRLIDAARDRFYRDGFAGVGIDQILADVGISKTAFYKYFESKIDLMLAVMDRQDRWLRGRFRDMVESCGADPQARLLAVFDVVDEIIKLDGFRGCFFVNVAMEFPLPHDPPHVAAADNKRAIHELVEELARQAGAHEPHVLAKQLILLMEGAYVSRHVIGDQGVAQMARRAAATLIDHHLGMKAS